MKSDPHDAKQQLAAGFGRTTDPLAEYESIFKQADADPLDLYIEEIVEPRNLDGDTMGYYHCVLRQWRKWMTRQARHPACPNEDHVLGFIKWRRDDHGNGPGTIRQKLTVLGGVYDYWVDDPAFPHDQDFHPIRSARKKVDLTKDPEEKERDYPRISLEDHRERISNIDHIRDRAIVVLQLKLGLRAGEVANIQLRDFHIHNQQDLLRDHYPDLGTHPRLEGNRDAIYVPPSFKRDGNKSDRPRTLPLDEEARAVLLRYLLIRPDVDEDELFLSQKSFVGLRPEDVTLTWGRHYDEFDADAESRNVRSHYGRHFFTSHFEIHKDWPTEKVQWMRGDQLQNSDWEGKQSIDHYLHAHYPDVEDDYREEIFKLHL